MACANTLLIDGVTYRADDPTSSEVRIVILQRGWVMVGRFKREGEMCSLDDASVIRTWGTKNGLGELRNGPLSTTKLDKAGHVEFHVLAVVATIDCDASKWVL